MPTSKAPKHPDELFTFIRDQRANMLTEQSLGCIISALTLRGAEGELDLDSLLSLLSERWSRLTPQKRHERIQRARDKAALLMPPLKPKAA